MTLVISSSDWPLIALLAREEVARLAPQELPHFRAMSEEYRRDPAKGLIRQAANAGDNMLGMGAGEVVIFITPYVLPVVTAVVTFVTAELRQDLLKDVAANAVYDVAKGLLRINDTTADAEPPETARFRFTAQQVAEVRQEAIGVAIRVGMPRDQAVLLADALAGRLALP